MPVEPALILASASPRRSDLLTEAGYCFAIIKPLVEEIEDETIPIRELTALNASLKAEAVAGDFPDKVVIGADTLVLLGEKVFSKPVDRAEATRMLAELNGHFVPQQEGLDLAALIVTPVRPAAPAAPTPMPAPDFKLGEEIATREAYGLALAKLGAADSRVVALDADVKNSTFSDKFEKAFPERFYQNFIAEQVMVGSAMGLAARGAIPCPSTFAAFLTRAADFIRMMAISNLNVKLAGSHAGVSIGEDGPSQMALEDLSMFRSQPNFAVLYPCDAVSTERLMAVMAAHKGPAYMRTSRPKTPVIYGPDETFELGGLKVIRQSANDVVTVVGAGVTLFEALKAHDVLKAEGIAIRVIDLYSLAPIAKDALIAAGSATKGRIITVEDHYPAGGIGDAVSEAVIEAGIRVHRIAVREIPRSGKPEELLERFGISASHIVAAVKNLK